MSKVVKKEGGGGRGGGGKREEEIFKVVRPDLMRENISQLV